MREGKKKGIKNRREEIGRGGGGTKSLVTLLHNYGMIPNISKRGADGLCYKKKEQKIRFQVLCISYLVPSKYIITWNPVTHRTYIT